jgi:hypothetical protein
MECHLVKTIWKRSGTFKTTYKHIHMEVYRFVNFHGWLWNLFNDLKKLMAHIHFLNFFLFLQGGLDVITIRFYKKPHQKLNVTINVSIDIK